jgi:DNA-nicking Smr family endonuclease
VGTSGDRGDGSSDGIPGGRDPFDGPVALPLDGVLDLHAFDPRDLGTLLPAWIDDSHAAGLRALRVIHGKGTGALRRSVEKLLARHPKVAAFRPAGEGAGGWGATLVELRD